MTVRDLVISVVRTFIPMLAGFLLTLALRAGIELDSAYAFGLADLIITSLYYIIFRSLETKWPAFGVLLGWKVPPVYGNSTGSSVTTSALPRY